MRLETFFDNFDLLADAPNGVQKLRELILQLAVQGKLVPQDPNDEPVSVLLEKIKVEREWLIKQKKIKKDETLPPIEVDEIPSTLPKGWEWARLGNLARFIDYRGKTPPKIESGVKLITAKNVRMGFIKDDPKEYISEKTYQEWMTRGFPQYGDLLFTTEAPLGNIAQLLTTEKVALAQRVIDFQTFSALFSPYLKFALMSPIMQDSIRYKATGMTAEGIKAAKLKLLLVPIPPLEEQKRIVAKVDQLMSLCDQLDARQRHRREGRVRLNNAALDQLLTTRDPDAFAKHWQRICNNFDLLYSAPENIGKLRQAILQLAVQGKLVPQDPTDEPASVLLEKIKAEKERLVKEKKIRKDELLPPSAADDSLYQLPEGWQWCRWNDIALHIGDVDHKMPTEVEEGIPYVSPRDFTSNNGINFAGAKKISLNDFERLRKKIQPEQNDIIFPRYGTIGENRYVETNSDFLASYSCAVIKSLKGFLEPKYSFYYSLSQLVKGEIERYINKTTQANVGVKSIKKFPFPLPPLNEQKRIVAKVDQLMALCNKLETKLTQSQTDSETLMDAAVRQVLVA